MKMHKCVCVHYSFSALDFPSVHVPFPQGETLSLVELENNESAVR